MTTHMNISSFYFMLTLRINAKAVKPKNGTWLFRHSIYALTSWFYLIKIVKCLIISYSCYGLCQLKKCTDT